LHHSCPSANAVLFVPNTKDNITTTMLSFVTNLFIGITSVLWSFKTNQRIGTARAPNAQLKIAAQHAYF
jgi:hypothetical protein